MASDSSSTLEIIYIVVTFLILVAVHVVLRLVLSGRKLHSKSMAGLLGLSLITSTIWVVLAFGFGFLLDFCPACGATTIQDVVYDLTLGLPLTVCVVLPMPDFLPSFGLPLCLVYMPVLFTPLIFLLSLPLRIAPRTNMLNPD